MNRIPLFIVLCLPAAAATQAPPPTPRIELSAAGESGGSITDGEGAASVSGKIILPPGWKLSVHVLTIRYAKDGGAQTLNTLLAVRGNIEFSTNLTLESGSYKIWAVIDVKDDKGRERQISSDPKMISVQ
jgi:uncharacterized lipoprotein YbaY